MNGRKTVVLGSGGRLGAAVVRRLRESGGDVATFSHRDLDLRDQDAARDALAGRDFDWMINCAALTSVDYCETHPDEAHEVNAAAPALLAEICRDSGARLVHVSTDYVYAGTEPGERVESDPTVPASVYGRSKLEGERAVLSVDPGFPVIRTSWVFGPDRPSFVDMIIDRAREQSRVTAIADKVSSPCYSLDFAWQLEALLDAADAGGVINLCCEGSCTWQEYGQVAVDAAAACGLELRATEVEALSLADMTNFVAPRPSFTAMSTARFTRLTGLRPRPWREAVREYVERFYVPRARSASNSA